MNENLMAAVEIQACDLAWIINVTWFWFSCARLPIRAVPVHRFPALARLAAGAGG